jgi:antitoxin component YwqK of YwqJK toxin-antitoxin module
LFLSGNSVEGQIDAKDGMVKIYYPNGQVSSEGMVRDGKPDGYWKTYYVTGVIKSEGKRTNFLLDSTWLFYNQVGELTEEINYQLGKRSGYTLKYTYDNPNQPGRKTLVSKELYVNDKKEGISFYYYKTGELKEEVYFANGKRSGIAKEYDKEGTMVTYMQYKDNFLINRERINRKDDEGRRQGTYKEFYQDGSLKIESNYLDDQLHGYYRQFDEQGNLLQSLRYERGAVVEEIDEEAREIIDFKRTFDEQGRLVFSGGYIENVPIGIHRFFDTTGTVVNAIIYNENGVKISEGVVDEQGNRRGPWTDFYLTGEVKARGSYRNNLRTGEWTYYFRNGRVEQTGNYLRGRFDGEWVWNHDNGAIWRKEFYFNGNEDGYLVEYDREGNIITEGNYINGEKDGEWFYTMGDHTEKGKYIIGLKEGKWEHFYQDGSTKFIGNYLQGQPDGRQVYFYPDGSIEEEQYYERGIREKTWRKYDREGNVFIAISYKANNEVRINGIRVRLPESDTKVIQ